MNTSKFIVATLAGGVALFIMGFLVYAVIMEGFFTAHAGTATNVIKVQMAFWPLILGNFSLAALLAYVFMKWANIRTLAAGFSAALAMGFFISLGYDMISYDTTNLLDLAGTIGDIVVFTIMFGIAGAIVGWVLGLGKQ